MRIREATVNDAADLARVHVDVWRTTYKGIVPDAHLAGLSYERSESRWRDALTDAASSSFTYVAEDADGRVIGFATGGAEREGDAIYTGELWGMYLLKSHQRQGIGRALVAAVARRLVQQGMAAMLVWVLAANPARAFYESLGGKLLREKEIVIGGATLVEVAYGWEDARVLLQPVGAKG